MKKIRLIYVSSEYSGAVVEGQVYKLLDYYISKGFFEEVVLLQQYTSSKNRKITEDILSNHNFKYRLFKAKIYNPFKDYNTKRAISNLLKQEINSVDYIIHTRSIIMAYHVFKALYSIKKPLNILADERGYIFNELKFRTKQSNTINSKIKYYLQYLYFLYCYKFVNKKEIKITTISNKLKELLVENKFIESNICVHPNIASDIFKYSDELRYSIRERLGVLKDESLVILSSGEGGIWQNDIEIIDVLLRQNIKILNLGKNKVEKQGVINLFVPHNEMPFYLSAADIAVLWRENLILNQVACPSKFGEFAVMGLYVIHNNSVDIATKFLSDNNIGLLVNTADEIIINNSSSYYQLERQSRIELGKKIFSVEEIAKSYYDNYISICRD